MKVDRTKRIANQPTGTSQFEHNVDRFMTTFSQLISKAPSWTGVGIMLLLIIILLVITQPLFLTYTNISNVFVGMAVTLLLAIGSTYLITTGMVDLSLGSLLALSTMVLAGLINLRVPILLAALGTVIFATLASGGLNGVLIAKAKLPFFVVTLGALSIFSSLAELPTQGVSVDLSQQPGFGTIEWLGDGKLLGISVPVIIALLGLLLSIAIMGYTTFGRAIFAVGGNSAAARLAGIPVDRVRIAAFAINGTFIGLASVLFAGRIQSGSPTAGQGFELDVIAAVLLGGSSFLGGSSSLIGTFIGVLFIAILHNGLDLVGVNTFWQGVVTGSVLILAVWIDRIRSSRSH